MLTMKPSEQPDLYQRLGLEPSANPDEIKQAYRQKAFEWHPDRNPNDHSLHKEFIAVSQAYEVLSDYPTRREYDIERARAQPSSSLSKGFKNSTRSTLEERLNQAFDRIAQNFEKKRAYKEFIWNKYNIH